MTLSGYINYKGKSCRVMSFDDAMAEYRRQKAEGKKPAVISVRGGYIVTEAVFMDNIEPKEMK